MCSRTTSRAAALVGRIGWLSLAAVAGVSGVAVLSSADAARAQDVAPITIVINQSPWFKGFAGLIDYYEEQTGNKVTLDVNPFLGSIEKQRASARAPEGTIDLFVTNARIMPEMYDSGLVHTMDELAPDFKLDPNISTFDDSVCWDFDKKSFNCETGKLMGVPINPNIQMLYYRSDLYEEAGIDKVPETWDAFVDVCEKVESDDVICIAQRGARQGIGYNFFPYLRSFGGDIFKDPAAGDYTVTINSPEALEALKFYVDLAAEHGHPQTGSIGQAEMIQQFATGKAAHIIAVIAAWDQLDDPDKSLVAGNFNVGIIPTTANHPHNTTIGHFVSTIPRNIPDERKQAAVEFLKWFQTFDAQREYAVRGGVPVRSDVLTSDLSKEPRYRWMAPLAENFKNGKIWYDIPEVGEVVAVTELRWNQAVVGELSPEEALNQAAADIHDIMERAGYQTGMLDKL
jgi:multiple sugar transport system substrate-binding protein